MLAMACLDSIQNFFFLGQTEILVAFVLKTLWRYDEIESGVLMPVFSSGLEEVIKNILR